MISAVVVELVFEGNAVVLFVVDGVVDVVLIVVEDVVDDVDVDVVVVLDVVVVVEDVVCTLQEEKLSKAQRRDSDTDMFCCD